MSQRTDSLVLLLALLLVAPARAAGPDYLREIKPVLTQQCVGCHGDRQQKGGLRLDTAANALKGGDTGKAFEPGAASKSLLIMAVEGTNDDIQRMPLKKPALPSATIQKLRAWIDAGALAPANEEPGDATHWAFKELVRTTPPNVKNLRWVKNELDRFILARLEKEQITPSREAAAVTLIRRASLDLTGLPPTPEEIDQFLADQQPGAYERLVDRLLSSPHFGERWGRLWLDVARYADSNGYSIDAPRSIWRYRDWVIDAINANMPFDQFTIEQIAGDMLPSPTFAQKVATGFHRNTMINEEGGIDKEQFRVESVLDRVNTTSAAFLGVTFGCAQCHDHKFDPFSQKDYYQFFAFFNNADEPTVDVMDRKMPFDAAKHAEEVREAEANLEKFLASLKAEQAAWEENILKTPSSAPKPEVVDVAKIAPEKRTERQKVLMADNFLLNNPEYKERKGKISSLKREGRKQPTTMIIKELAKPRESFIFIKGDFTRRGADVKPGVPETLPGLAKKGDLNRLDLAHWLVATNNPLTARVTVNRMWQQYFGKGLVETENDFGTQGTPPTHPELLDWLATEFMRSGWNVKAMHRLIATSATYRQASKTRPDLQMVDPNNRLLARQSRLRLDAELIRDSALQASGLLTPTIGGPSVFPPQPDGVMTLGQSKREWKESRGADRYRRAMYTFFWRATPHPDLVVFDAPDGTSTCTRRLRSNTPLQSLTLLNDKGFYEFAQSLAERVSQGKGTDDEKLRYAFRLCLGRSPLPAEAARLSQLFQEDQDRKSSWTTVCRVLLNLDETITRE